MVRLSKTRKRKQKGGCGCAANMSGGKRRYRKYKSRRKRKRKRILKRTKRRLRNKRKRKSRLKKQRGGNLLANPNMSGFKCNTPGNLGDHFGNKLNTQPFLPDSANLNRNTKMNIQKGGGFMQDFGLGDVLQYWYKGNDAVSNTIHRYKGGKLKPNADVMYQPRLKGEGYIFNHSNVGKTHSKAALDVAADIA